MRAPIYKIVETGAEFFGAIVSALAWANLLTGHSDARGALIAFGGLVLPFVDSRLRRLRRRGLATYVSAAAGISAICVQYSLEPGPRVLGQVFWLEGTRSIALNTTYAYALLPLLILWWAVLVSINRVAH